MKRFKFSLATLLEVRKKREEWLQKKLGMLQARKIEIQRRLLLLSQEVDALQEEQKQLRTASRNTVIEEKIYLERLTDYRLRIQEGTDLLLKNEEDIEAARLEWIAASKEKKVLEKLEDRQWRNYLEVADKQEQYFMDELAQHQFFRRQLQPL